LFRNEDALQIPFPFTIVTVSSGSLEPSAGKITKIRERKSLAAKLMQYNQLGDSDLKVSEICLGTMTFGQQNSLDDAQ
jgi:hypothetical protein